MERTIELDEYRRRSREGLSAMRSLLQQMTDAFPEGKKPALFISVLSDHTHDDVLSVFGMCLEVEEDEVLSDATHASFTVHADTNKLTQITMAADSCPDFHLVQLMRNATRQYRRLMYRRAPQYLL